MRIIKQPIKKKDFKERDLIIWSVIYERFLRKIIFIIVGSLYFYYNFKQDLFKFCLDISYILLEFFYIKKNIGIKLIVYENFFFLNLNFCEICIKIFIIFVVLIMLIFFYLEYKNFYNTIVYFTCVYVGKLKNNLAIFKRYTPKEEGKWYEVTNMYYIINYVKNKQILYTRMEKYSKKGKRRNKNRIYKQTFLALCIIFTYIYIIKISLYIYTYILTGEILKIIFGLIHGIFLTQVPMWSYHFIVTSEKKFFIKSYRVFIRIWKTFYCILIFLGEYLRRYIQLFLEKLCNQIIYIYIERNTLDNVENYLYTLGNITYLGSWIIILIFYIIIMIKIFKLKSRYKIPLSQTKLYINH